MQLSSAQIDSVLGRNTDLRLRVIEFNALVAAFGWSQVKTTDWFYIDAHSIPGAIPAEGIYVQDSQFGKVVIFPDANGVLRFNTTENVGSAHLIGPSGLPPLPSLPALTTLLILVALAFVVFEVAPIVMLAMSKREAH